MIAVAIAVASVAAFIFSSTYYALLSPLEARALGDRTPDRGSTAPWKVALEVVRSAVLASVFTYVARRADMTDIGPALLLAVVLWLGFAVVLLTGSVIWERVPIVTATLHAGDWLLKLLLIALIVALFI